MEANVCILQQKFAGIAQILISIATNRAIKITDGYLKSSIICGQKTSKKHN